MGVEQVAACPFAAAELLFSQPPLGLKELRQHGPTWLGQNPRYHLALVIEAGVVEQLKQRGHRPRFGVGRTIDHDGDAGLQNRPGTHGARFERHVQPALLETLIANRLGRLGYGDHLGMSGWIAQLLTLVVSRRDDPIAAHDDRTDWNFVFRECLLGLLERLPHEVFMHRTHLLPISYFPQPVASIPLQHLRRATCAHPMVARLRVRGIEYSAVRIE